MFIRLMFGGQSLLQDSPQEKEDIDMDRKEADTQTRVLSLAQDLVYNVTGGKKWTPKHVGLASTLHQATRSKELVQHFHNAGHTVSYHSLLQVHTAMAEKTLHTMDPETGTVTLANCIPGRFTHFSCDNIDIDDAGLGGKDSFHATQMAAWQHGPEEDTMMKDMKPSHKKSLQVPQIVQEIFSAGVVEGKVHEMDTLNTVVIRCKNVANKHGQHHIVITADEQLFYKLMELKWTKSEYKHFLVIRLGGLHTALKFLDLKRHGLKAMYLV